jgi:flagellar biosynthesis GTPase FlhF
VLVTCSQSNTEGKARTAAEVVKLIRGQLGDNDLITRARKLLSGAFALTFKSIKAKKAWQE